MKIIEQKVYSPVCKKHFILGIWVREGEIKKLTLTGKYVRYGYIFEATVPVSQAECEKLGIDIKRALRKALKNVIVEEEV